MNSNNNSYDMVVIGSGPAGLNAALAAAGNGARVLVIEKELEVGGACVQYGTIPSKTLRETAVTLTAFQRRSGNVYDISRQPELQIECLMSRLQQVVGAHQKSTRRYLETAGVERMHGDASFVSDHEVRVRANSGKETLVTGDVIVIATGSRPRNPPNIPVDHENILDSDSILSMTYLPRTLTIFGGGVIACEYASTFASLGVRVVMIDRYPSPLGFLDPVLVQEFLRQFKANDGLFLGNTESYSVEWDGVSSVVTTLDGGEEIATDKAFVAQGRIANTDSLGLDATGVTLSDRGVIDVNESCQTQVPWIYAVGDSIGPPALASTSMEQGRRAAHHALGIDVSHQRNPPTPMGIYTIPEIASIGMTEAAAVEANGSALVGRTLLADLARGQIMASSGGILKLVSDPQGNQVLGVQIVGDGATDLIHLGQMAMAAGMTIDDLAGSIFNFPTLAEAYRIAAIEVIRMRRAQSQTKVSEPVAEPASAS